MLPKNVTMTRAEVLRELRKKGFEGFQLDVLMATYDIPKGETRTYKEIAVAVGRPRAFRAVGSTLKINPLAPVVPCHRVIKSDGSIGNYTAPGGSRRKMTMLKAENAL